jgi:hypothetical protein
MGADAVGDMPDTRTSKLNQESRISDFIHALIISLSFQSSSYHCVFPVYYSTIIAEQKVKSSLSISLYIDHELRLSAADTKYITHLRLSVVGLFSQLPVVI